MAVRQDAACRLFHKPRAPDPQPGSDDEHRNGIPQQPLAFLPINRSLERNRLQCSGALFDGCFKQRRVGGLSTRTQLLLQLENVEEAIADLGKVLTDQSTGLFVGQPFADSGPLQQRYHEPHHQQNRASSQQGPKQDRSASNSKAPNGLQKRKSDARAHQNRQGPQGSVDELIEVVGSDEFIELLDEASALGHSLTKLQSNTGLTFGYCVRESGQGECVYF